MTIKKILPFDIFNTSPLIDQASANWICDTFNWALKHFDGKEFYERSKLVQPNNQFFPGKVDSVHALANNIFKHTLTYAGLEHWPFELQAPEQFQGLPPPQLSLETTQQSIGRNSISNNGLPALKTEQPLYVSYKPQQTGKPEDLSSTYAHLLAQHVAIQMRLAPPGGPDYFAAGTEILAIFMGFGVMFANSAFTYRGGCGSCYNAQANRQATLSEDEAVFALTLYCHHKKIPYKEATQSLKKHLRSSYKRAEKQIIDMKT